MMKARELFNLGIPKGEAMQTAMRAAADAAHTGMKNKTVRQVMASVAGNPQAYESDPVFGKLATVLQKVAKARASYRERAESAPWKQWGENLDDNAVQQMRNACRLPVTVQGALMPDAHQGYGLPIGGVMATENAVVPYAVGVDIACRMKMTVLDLPVNAVTAQEGRLRKAIESETRFGIGASFKTRRVHPVLDEDWRFSGVTADLKDKAWRQLGTSGSGNHFAEFGTLTVQQEGLGLEPGEYLALLSHSGSRGTGATVADHYSKLAMRLRPQLPRELMHLAWLDMDSEAGQEYWQVMELMGHYAAANHALIHRHIAKHLGAEVLADFENHHNFAWKEVHNGRHVIVHRKGATPAGQGAIGIIPGSMATSGYVVRGKGNALSLNSAAHGAGRRMSRKAAKQQYTWPQAKQFLRERGVVLISAGLDEVPMAYKDIEVVMAAQGDLVEPLARFDPKLVKMAPAGERPED
ncbi:MAG: RtcB family protein [Planctomycetota bacterium]|jgi:tRNA-splicing ligase RtcB